RPGPVIGTGKDEIDTFEVEEIVNSKPARGRYKFRYVVKWKGWPSEDNTEEPPEHLKDSQEAVWKYHEKYPRKPRPKGYIHRAATSSQELA
ncbi:MAG: hypothetical protein M1823_006392, partial [Watsoniomyces obsoletus]